MRRNLFIDPSDFHARHEDIAEKLELSAQWVKDAHAVRAGSDTWAECLVRAEREALAANADLVTLLGADPAVLLPLVRLTVEAMAHAAPCGQVTK